MRRLSSLTVVTDTLVVIIVATLNADPPHKKSYDVHAQNS